MKNLQKKKERIENKKARKKARKIRKKFWSNPFAIFGIFKS